MTKWHRLGGLRTDTHISQLWRQESPRSRSARLFLARAFFLAGRWPFAHYVSTWSRDRQTETERIKRALLCLPKNTNPIILGPHLMTFTLTYLLKVLFPDTVALEVGFNIQRGWGQGDTIQSHNPGSMSQGSEHPLLFLSPTVIWTPWFIGSWPQISLQPIPSLRLCHYPFSSGAPVPSLGHPCG